MELSKPIEQLNVNSNDLAAAWKDFRRNFEKYLLATGSINLAESIKVAILLNAVGPGGLKLYNMFKLTPLEQNNMARILMEFEKYCEAHDKQRNQLYDTYTFENRRQTADETFDAFVDELKRLVKYCRYKNEDHMLRDRIVFGILDCLLQKRYFDMVELNLDQAIEMGRAHERERMNFKNTSNLPISLDWEQYQTQPWLRKLCSYCHLPHLPKTNCPAYGKVCLYCNKPNHFIAACRIKRKYETGLVDVYKVRE